MRVTSIVYDGTSYGVDWSWAHDPDTSDGVTAEHTDATLPVADLPRIAPNDSVVLVEVDIPYTPITDIAGIPATNWTPSVIVRPRYIASIVKTD